MPRLRTGHNSLNYLLHSTALTGHTEQCLCSSGSQKTEHLLQFCPIYVPLRKGTWPDHTPVICKLYSNLEDLQRTATFITYRLGYNLTNKKKTITAFNVLAGWTFCYSKQPA